MRHLLLALALVLAPFSAMAQGADKITVERATTLGLGSPLPTAGVFMIIHNKSGVDDVLKSVKTPVTPKADLHTSAVDEKGIMSMRPVAGITLPAGKSITLNPAGDHIMLMELTQALKAGEKLPLTLVFEKAGEKEVSVDIVTPDDLTKRFPPETMSDNLHKMRGAQAEQKPSLAARLRAKIRGVTGDEADKGKPGVSRTEPVPAPEAQTPVLPEGVAPLPDPTKPALRMAPDPEIAPAPAEDTSVEEAEKPSVDPHAGHH